MERQNRTISLLLVVLLAMGVFHSYQIRNLRQEIDNAANRLANQVAQTQDSLRSAISSVNHSIARLSEAEQWTHPPRYAALPELSDPDNLVLEIAWSFRELFRDAVVYLQYRPYGQGQVSDWTRAETSSRGGGSYSAIVNLSPELTYEYQIVADGAQFRVSEAVVIPRNLYQPQPLVVRAYGGSRDRDGKWVGTMTLEVEQSRISSFAFFAPAEVHLMLKRADGTMTMVRPEHIKRDGGYQAFIFNFGVENVTSTQLIVTYEDGSVYYADFWPSDGSGIIHEIILDFRRLEPSS